ncbi:hypothetical protein C8Q70DRAFT_700522 [Cubamyces menziesii]|nr:hypothetical protein C8Q70DRAFT_700522 [Cubamyces menziesii]
MFFSFKPNADGVGGTYERSSELVASSLDIRAVITGILKDMWSDCQPCLLLKISASVDKNERSSTLALPRSLVATSASRALSGCDCEPPGDSGGLSWFAIKRGDMLMSAFMRPPHAPWWVLFTRRHRRPARTCGRHAAVRARSAAVRAVMHRPWRPPCEQTVVGARAAPHRNQPGSPQASLGGPNAVNMTEKFNVAYELIEVRTGDGERPAFRNGRTPAGTIEAVRAEVRDVLTKAFGEDGARKRERLLQLQQEVLSEWGEGGASRKDFVAFLDSLRA